MNPHVVDSWWAWSEGIEWRVALYDDGSLPYVQQGFVFSLRDWWYVVCMVACTGSWGVWLTYALFLCVLGGMWCVW